MIIKYTITEISFYICEILLSSSIVFKDKEVRVEVLESRTTHMSTLHKTHPEEYNVLLFSIS